MLEFVLELGKLRRQRTRGLLGDFVWLNTNRVDFGMEISSPRGVRFAAVSDQPGFTRHAVEERQPVIFRLETEQVVIRQCFKNFIMLRQCRKDLRGRERNMQEEADPVLHTPFTQLPGEGQQMVIVDP
ncbi:Uncharacterised protein [Enterobacter cloacae]|nr:Uncharacterised protein [Enterobacter cloacae]